MTPEQEAIVEDLRTKHGDVLALEAADSLVVFRPMQIVDWRTLKKNQRDEAKRTVVEELLIQALVVYPTRAEMDAIVGRKPVMTAKIAENILEHNGGAEGDVKKL